jgi:zinc transport system substrate-binding protein
LKKLQEAEIYFRIGHISFEKAQIGKLAQVNSRMKVVDTSEGISFIKLTAHEHENGSGQEGEYESGDDPHIWLSPKLVKIQAGHIYSALVEARPADEAYFRDNYNRFLSDLDSLDADLKDVFAPIKGRTILVFHPAFGYLANEYGFKQEAIEIDGKDPSPEHLRAIIDKALVDEVKVIFVQRQFSAKSAEAIADEVSGAVVQIDPLAKDYFTNLENMSQVITKSLQ